MSQNIGLVVFDLGGVLVQAGRSWTEAAGELGFTFHPEWLTEFEQRMSLVPRMARGQVSSEAYFERFAEASAGVFSAADAERISHASLAGEYPGIDSVFDRLEAAGVATAALSNTSDDHWRRLFPTTADVAEFPTLLRIEHRFASHLLAIEKPEPGAYMAVEQHTGHSGASILFFDDKEENLVAARAIGWHTQHIDHLSDPVPQLLASLSAFGI